MTRSLRPFLPAEHGAWGILVSSLLLGALSVPFRPMAIMGIGLASLGALLLRNPLLRWLRAGTIRSPRRAFAGFPWPGWVFAGALIGMGALPLIVLRRWALGGVALAALAALFVEARSVKTNPRSRMTAELISALTVSLLAPATAYAATGTLGWDTTTLWLLCTLYFAMTTLDVRWRIARLYHRQGIIPAERTEQARLDRKTALVAGAVLAGLYWMAAPVPWMMALALLPLAFRFWRPTSETQAVAKDLRRLGWQEVQLSFVFVGVSAALMRLH